MKNTELIAFVVGILVGGFVTTFVIQSTQPQHHMDSDKHPIGYADSAEEVHVHSDFVLYFDGGQIDLSDDKYQSESDQILHAHIHLHDNNDDVIHRHAHDVTLSDFFGSLGFNLTNDCLTDDTGVAFCTTDTEELMVFVNDERINEPATYVNQEEDRILIYHGDKDDNETIRTLLLGITDKACIYSGTCPERGTPPPESCGLTCEL